MVRPNKMLLTPCFSHQDQALLKSYPLFHPCLRILIVGKSSQLETNVEG